MSIADEIKQQQSQYKDMPLKKKIEHFFYYNKWKVIAGVFVLFLCFDLVANMLKTKDILFHCILINPQTISYSSDEMASDFSVYSGINTKKQEVLFENQQMNFDKENELNYSNITAFDGAERIIVLINAGELDALIGPKAMINEYESMGCLGDINDFLPQDLINRLSESNCELIYIGNKLTAINLSSLDAFSKYNLYDEKENQYLSIIGNAPNTDMLISYIEFLLSDN